MRSKLITVITNLRPFCRFNSDTVRSKPHSSLTKRSLTEFQFRHGAIKTLRDISCQSDSICGFNSDTVRSKRRISTPAYGIQKCFNSDTVRSKPRSVQSRVVENEVSIPTRCDQNSLRTRGDTLLCRFNSDTVRSKPGTAYLNSAVCKGFNSDTVRSKPRCIPQPASTELVSIPTRCDQNAWSLNDQIVRALFQFRHGAIKTYGHVIRRGENISFNSDTVRSKLYHHLAPIDNPVVSIPTRCDQNWGKREWALVRAKFQFRHGAIKTETAMSSVRGTFAVSIPTRCDQNRARLATATCSSSVSIPTRCDQNGARVTAGGRRAFVSIPTRCDQNGYWLLSPFALLEVSIPTRCDQNDIRTLRFKRTSRVSIPTRCDQNGNIARCSAAPARFQFRHGAIKTHPAKSIPEPTITFQFRHGAIKTSLNKSIPQFTFLFQFRHGAIKTLCKRSFLLLCICFNSDTVRSKLVDVRGFQDRR